MKITKTLGLIPLALTLSFACNNGSTPDDAGGEPNSSGGKASGGASGGGKSGSGGKSASGGKTSSGGKSAGGGTASGGLSTSGGDGGEGGVPTSGGAPGCDAPDPPSWAAMGGFGGAYGEPEAELNDSLTGSYVDNYGGQHDIGASSWDTGYSLFHYAYVNNEERWIVALNDSSNGYFPDLWSKFVLLETAEDLYYCQSAYAAPSFEDAYCDSAADPSNLVSGCSGFAWSKLEAVAP